MEGLVYRHRGARDEVLYIDGAREEIITYMACEKQKVSKVNGACKTSVLSVKYK